MIQRENKDVNVMIIGLSFYVIIIGNADTNALVLGLVNRGNLRLVAVNSSCCSLLYVRQGCHSCFRLPDPMSGLCCVV